MGMKWASAVSVEPHLEQAVADAGVEVARRLATASPSLIVGFVSAHHEADYERLPELVAERFDRALLVGCSAGGVIGGGKEVERAPGLSLTGAVLPGVELSGFHHQTGVLPDPVAQPEEWASLVRVPAARQPQFLLLGDPFTCDPEVFVHGLDQSFPESRTIGGLASGGQESGANVLYLGDQIYRAGLVGVAMHGDIVVDTIVAQGCRPIGEPMFVTSCQRNIVRELDGRTPVQVLHELFESLEQRDQELFRQSLFLGLVMSDARQEYHRGDFLIRNIVGIDGKTGALAIAALARQNQVVQFHLRDAQTSAQDLEELLSRYRQGEGGAAAEGSLLFSCLGRGEHLYGRPNHDTDVFRRHLGDIALGGFFCNGEIGPVHGTTFVHGYTSAFGIFRGRG